MNVCPKNIPFVALENCEADGGDGPGFRRARPTFLVNDSGNNFGGIGDPKHRLLVPVLRLMPDGAIPSASANASGSGVVHRHPLAWQNNMKKNIANLAMTK
jgi:hypothetical protein